MQISKRITALLLALIMCLSLLSNSIYAMEYDSQETSIPYEQMENDYCEEGSNAEEHSESAEEDAASEEQSRIVEEGESSENLESGLKAQEDVHSGSCGPNTTWDFDDRSNTLTIRGEWIRDCNDETEQPWYNYRHKIEKVIIHEGVSYIGQAAFSYCDKIKKVKLPNSLEVIGNVAFGSCYSLLEINLNDNLLKIGNGAFAHCSSLESITIPARVKVIEYGSFEDCKRLKMINVNHNNLYFCEDKGVLYDKKKSRIISCVATKEGVYSVPNSVKSIDPHAFYGCESITEIIIPDSVNNIGDIAFEGCLKCRRITVNNDNLYYSSLDGVLFDKNQRELIKYPSNKPGDYEIPGSVQSIKGHAFCFTNLLSEVIIPENITVIEDYTFGGSNGIKRVSLPKSIKSIGFAAFSSCGSDFSVFFHGPAPQINKMAFTSTKATSYYPPNDSSWTKDVMQDYGGNITWVPSDSWIMLNKEEIETNINENAALTGSLRSSEIPSSSDIEWSIKRKEVEAKDTVTFDSCSILTTGEREYIFSRMASFSEPGIYVVKAAFKGTSDACKVIVKPAVIEDFIVNATDRGKICLEWPDMKGVDGFRIQYSEKKNFKKYETKDVDIISTEFDEKEGTRKYSWKNKNSEIPFVYVRIAAFIKDGNQIIQGDWSEVDENTKAVFTYNAERDGWCIPNWKYSFGDGSYRFSSESFENSFAIIPSPLAKISYDHYYLYKILLAELLHDDDYNGSCHGMSVLSVGNYLQKVDMKEVCQQEGLGLSEYGNSGAISVDGLNSFTLQYNPDAVHLIERCFWSQLSTQFYNARMNLDNKGLIDYLNQTKKPNPIVVTLEGEMKEDKNGKKVDGDKHTVVIDPSIKPEEVSKDVYKLHLYDPNVPSGGNRLPSIVGDQYSTESYLLVKTAGDQDWKYWWGRGDNTILTIKNIDHLWAHRFIDYFDLSKLPDKFFTTQRYTFRSLVKAYFASNGAELTCSDDSGGTLTIKDGVITKLTGDIDYDTISTGDIRSSGKMVYFNSPVYSFSCDSGDVVFCNEQSSYRMTAGQVVSVSVSKTGIELSAENYDTDIQIEKLYSGDDHRINSADFSLTIPENHKISLIDSKDNSVKIQGDYTGSVDVNFSDGDMNHKGQVMIDGKKSVTVNESTFEGTPASDHTHIWKNASEDHGTSSESDYLITYTCSICGKTRVELYPATESGVITCKDVVKSYSVKKQSFKLNAKTEDGVKLSYKSNNKKIKVDKNGKVTLPAKFSGTVKITITAVATDQYAEATKTISVSVPTVPSVRKISSGKGQITVSWKKNTTGKGYEVQYSTDKTFKKTVKTVKIKKMNTTKATIKKLNTGTRYYLRIRTVNGKHYSNWSAIKSVKIV